MQTAELIIIGGANGSGKTTFALELQRQIGHKYIGADAIASELQARDPARVAIEAARIFSRRFSASLKAGESLLLESTLAGLSLRKFLIRAKAAGYRLQIYFVYLDSADLCLHRIAARVAGGGHPIPAADVRRRFYRANHNFWHAYRALADSWNLFFNGGEELQQIAAGQSAELVIFDDLRFEAWLSMIARSGSR